ncbi:MAG: peptidylprolyl isomerase [Spirochaetales bacterium]|nr:peptidylprolyl isomerase [Spirochaetales bacterium]
MKLKFHTTCIVLFFFIIAACAQTPDLPDGLYAKIETVKGDILLALEYKKVPLTVANFVGLAEGTINFSGRDAERFYDGLTFHRVVDDFVIQGGCPLGTGTGGPGYRFPDEFHPDLKHDRAGILSMANSGRDTNGSQFFITFKETPWLDGKHSVFGHVVEGMDVVKSIKKGDKIKRVVIYRIGEDAKKFRADQETFDNLASTLRMKNEQERKAEAQRQKEMQDAALAALQRKYPDIRTTESGLRYVILKKGKGGASPTANMQVKVHYTGSLLDGTVFDSSIDRGEPAVFRIGQLIQGWNEALLSMEKGEKRLLVVPPELGYGEQGVPGAIPPQAYLVFEMELLDFYK